MTLNFAEYIINTNILDFSNIPCNLKKEEIIKDLMNFLKNNEIIEIKKDGLFIAFYSEAANFKDFVADYGNLIKLNIRSCLSGNIFKLMNIGVQKWLLSNETHQNALVKFINENKIEILDLRCQYDNKIITSIIEKLDYNPNISKIIIENKLLDHNMLEILKEKFVNLADLVVNLNHNEDFDDNIVNYEFQNFNLTISNGSYSLKFTDATERSVLFADQIKKPLSIQFNYYPNQLQLKLDKHLDNLSPINISFDDDVTDISEAAQVEFHVEKNILDFSQIELNDVIIESLFNFVENYQPTEIKGIYSLINHYSINQIEKLKSFIIKYGNLIELNISGCLSGNIFKLMNIGVQKWLLSNETHQNALVKFINENKIEILDLRCQYDNKIITSIIEKLDYNPNISKIIIENKLLDHNMLEILKEKFVNFADLVVNVQNCDIFDKTLLDSVASCSNLIISEKDSFLKFIYNTEFLNIQKNLVLESIQINYTFGGLKYNLENITSDISDYFPIKPKNITIEFFNNANNNDINYWVKLLPSDLKEVTLHNCQELNEDNQKILLNKTGNCHIENYNSNTYNQGQASNNYPLKDILGSHDE